MLCSPTATVEEPKKRISENETSQEPATKKSKTEQKNSFMCLPPLSSYIPREVLECIFDYVSIREVKCCALVCKLWKEHVWMFVRTLVLNTFVKEAAIEFLSKSCVALQSLDLTNCSNITDNAMECICTMTQLKELKMKGCNGISCGALSQIETLHRLEYLQLPNSDKLEASIHFLPKLQHLKELDFSTCHQLKTLEVPLSNPHIFRLDFRKCTQLVDIIGILSLQNLRELSLQDCSQINDTHIVAISSCFPQLRYLDIQKCRVTNQGLKFISQLSQLQFLNLSKCQISPEGLNHLSILSQLQILYIDQIPHFNDDMLAEIGRLTSLKQVYAWEAAGVTNNGMCHLTNLVNLEVLDLYSCSGITDEGLRPLGALSNLKFLDLGYMRMTNDALGFLSPLVSLNHLCLPGCNALTLEGFRQLSNLKNLQDATLERCLHKVLKRGNNLKKPFVKCLL